MLKLEITTPLSPEDRALLAFLAGTPDTVPDTTVDKPAPDGRVYLEAEEGRKRRTKIQIAQDTAIEELFEKIKHVPGITETIPTDIPADEVLFGLEKIYDELPDASEEEEESFDNDEPVELDVFRAKVTAAMKVLAGKDVAAIMSPYKNAKAVPAERRGDYVEALDIAIADAA